ncbi:MFS transporter [Kineosporia sp. J2-2]|uniref:MFS transporter n=1 Tax=Kineosporia corallincola TaxID=2835133 RepID=A0ABS5TB42_9ACTN|nr:MFS transporter [Kineosporia corallincola]MBT0768287.1 MFS transporter [Kineosporia corallincola]
MRTGVLLRIWAGDTGARTGFQIFQFLLPVVAVTSTTATATEVGLLGAVQFLPVVLFSLAAGSLVTRFDAMLLLLVSNVLRLAAVGYLTVAALAGSLGLGDLMLAGFVVGTATIVYDVTFQSTVPRVVGPQSLQRVNGLLQGSISVVQMGAPALAGFLVAGLGGAGSFAVLTGVFFLVAAGFATRTVNTGGIVTTPVSVVEGLRYTWRDRYVRAICTQSAVFNLHEQAFMTVFLVYGLREVGLGSGAIGFAVGASSLGSLLGALVAGRLARVFHFGRVVSFSLPAAALALLLASLLPAGYVLPAFAVALAVNGFALGLYNVNAVSLRQITPPPEFLGPVTAAYRMLSFGTIPLGALIGGILLDLVPGRVALTVVAVSLLVLTCQIFATPVRSLALLPSPAVPPGEPMTEAVDG